MVNDVDNNTVVVRCANCQFIRQCRVVLRCGHPNGLKQPTYDSYCSYGEQKEEVPYEDKTN
jgi:hypothetical protein